MPFSRLLPSSQKNHWLYRQGTALSSLYAYSLAIIIACAFLAYLFPWAFFQGHSTVFDFGDNAQHVSGWWYYAKDAWHFPLLHTNRVDHPEGISIAFTDSIPFAALFFKVVMTVFPNWFGPQFHYFGWWVGLVFITQAVSSIFLMRTLGAKSLFATLVTLGFVLTWPVIHVRYSHAALMMHSIILMSLALYFLGIKKHRASGQTEKQKTIYIVLGFATLHSIALLVHPYFLPFVFGMFVAFLVDSHIGQHQQGHRPWIYAFGSITMVIVWLAFLAAIMGYLGRSTYRAGYGEHFNFNLLAPFCGNSRLIPCEYGAAPIIRFEGFNYFGAGLIFLLPFVVFLNRNNFRHIFKKYPTLMLVVLGLFLYAVSNHIWLGSHELFSFELPTWLYWLTGSFRAAGRFFWLIGYLILVLTLATLLKQKSRCATALLVFALLLQIKDVKPWLSHIRTEAAKPSVLKYADWSSVMERIDKVVIYPTFDCGPGDLHYYTWVMQLAGYYGKLLNSGYTSRDKKDCPASELAAQQPLEKRHLYVISSHTYFNDFFRHQFEFPEPIQHAILRNECVRRPDGLLCLPDSTPEFWKNISLNTYPATFLAKGIQLSGPEITSEIGVPRTSGFNAAMVAKDTATPGWLSFGPSISLPAGQYKYAIDYRSNEEIADRKISQLPSVGNWDVVLQQGGAGNEKILASGKLVGTSGLISRLEGVVHVAPNEEHMPLEIRTFYLAKGDLQLLNMSLVKLP